MIIYIKALIKYSNAKDARYRKGRKESFANCRNSFALLGVLSFLCVTVFSPSCNSHSHDNKENTVSCIADLPSRVAGVFKDSLRFKTSKGSSEGMVLIPAGRFMMGAHDDEGRPDEYPQHQVFVDRFLMDATEVTNLQFEKFVKETGYVTIAERKPDWEELKKQLPAGTARPDESLLQASSLVFTPPDQPVSLDNASQWWQWKKGADWRHPRGPGSDITGKENHPVVHIAWEDAMAYCKWAGKRLPTEAEWEWAARGGLTDNKYPWGNDWSETGKLKANVWQGSFPDKNILADKFYNSAPVKLFQPNNYGLYDMAGNVWEWCSDWYSSEYYQKEKNSSLENPRGPDASYDPMEPTVPKKTMRGGSFLCNPSYCKGYRVTARMKSSPDTGLEHTGFRCVKDL